jgi:hypothetical protein
MVHSKKLPAQIEQKLTKKQEAFVSAMVTTGGDRTAAAKILGYSDEKAGKAGEWLWRSSRVRAAFKEAVWDKLGTGAGLAVNTLLDLAAAGPAKVRREAADSILDRLGFKQQDSKTPGGVVINMTLSDLPATKTIEGTAQPVEEQPAISGKQGDELSLDPDGNP